MLKTKFSLTINGNGDELTPLTLIIANHNCGKAKIDLDVIVGYLQAQKAMLPNTRKDMEIKHEGSAPEIIHISDDGGKTFYLTITECTYEELVPENEPDNQILN